MNTIAALLAAIGALVFVCFAWLGETTHATAIMGVAACAIFGVAVLRRRGASGHVAMISLLMYAVFTVWASVSATLDSAVAVAIAIAIDIVAGGVVTAAVSALAATDRHRLAVAGAAAWALGWGLGAATLLWLAAWVLGLDRLGSLPDIGTAPSVLRLLGGLVFGGALAASMRDVGRRMTAIAVLAGFGALTLLAIVLARSLLGAVDVQAIETKRLLLGLAEAASSLALAGFVALYRRDIEVEQLPRATMR